MIDRLVVLGAVGDLATRHLLPALAHLHSAGGLPSGFRLLGVGREPLTTPEYQRLAEVSLAENARGVVAADRATLVTRMAYQQADLERQPDLGSALRTAPVVAYLALPPAVYAPAVKALRAGGIVPASRIVVEKPFGENLASARELSRLLHTVVAERNIFRVDHFLYHQTVQDMLALRFSNPFFEPLWNREHVKVVEITWEETTGVAGRTDFYDRTGALRDMVQSHLLQLLALVAMEAPSALDERSLRDAKTAVLRRIASLTPSEVAERTARGRYTAGDVEGQRLLGYTQEQNVDPSRGTETHACLHLMVDSPRWRGVPFVLRTGRALGRPRRRVALAFRAPQSRVVAGAPAQLCFEMSPDRVTFEVGASGPPGLPAIGPVLLEAARDRQQMPASARMLRDVLAGDPTFVVRNDEAEQCWRIIDSVVATWEQGVPPLQDYEAGSAGPLCPVQGIP